MKYKHYAPDAPMTIFRGSRQNVMKALETAVNEARAQGKKTGVIEYDENDYSTAERTLFARLREFDEQKVDVIFATAVSSEGEGFAVMNRMIKAAASNIVDV